MRPSFSEIVFLEANEMVPERYFLEKRPGRPKHWHQRAKIQGEPVLMMFRGVVPKNWCEYEPAVQGSSGERGVSDEQGGTRPTDASASFREGRGGLIETAWRSLIPPKIRQNSFYASHTSPTRLNLLFKVAGAAFVQSDVVMHESVLRKANSLPNSVHAEGHCALLLDYSVNEANEPGIVI